MDDIETKFVRVGWFDEATRIVEREAALGWWFSGPLNDGYLLVFQREREGEGP
jgi:hypothetical protein